MCISFEAFALFLNLLPSEIVETSPGQIIIHAEVRPAVWQVVDDQWCTEAPEIDNRQRS